jgi:hypothetical protein
LTQVAVYFKAQHPELLTYNNTALWYVKSKKMVAVLLFDLHQSIRTYLKNNLSAQGGVVKRFKMLAYYVYAPLFRRSTPCHEL